MEVRFHHSGGGRSAVLDWLLDLPDTELAICIGLLRRLQREGNQLGLPQSAPLGAGLFELRGHSDRMQLRMIYCFEKGQLCIIASGFIKQSPKTLAHELDLARRRQAELRRDPEGCSLEVGFEDLLTRQHKRTWRRR